MRKSRIIACLLCLFILAGCGGSENSLIGEWTIGQGENNAITITIEFKKDGTMIEKAVSPELSFQKEGTYKITGDKITMYYDDYEIEYTYTIKDNEFVMIYPHGTEIIWTRTK